MSVGLNCELTALFLSQKWREHFLCAMAGKVTTAEDWSVYTQSLSECVSLLDQIIISSHHHEGPMPRMQITPHWQPVPLDLQPVRQTAASGHPVPRAGAPGRPRPRRPSIRVPVRQVRVHAGAHSAVRRTDRQAAGGACCPSAAVAAGKRESEAVCSPRLWTPQPPAGEA